MNEMLANHYFLVRNYSEAVKVFEKAFQDDLPPGARKKLVICHLSLENYETAKLLFLGLLKEDPLFIINTNISDDDCPCPELLNEFEQKLQNNASLFEFLRVAMLWLYCDVNVSYEKFQQLNELYPKNSFIKEVITNLKPYINNNIKQVAQ